MKEKLTKVATNVASVSLGLTIFLVAGWLSCKANTFTLDTIPDNAQIYVFPTTKRWLPKLDLLKPVIDDIPEKSDLFNLLKESAKDIRETTYSEVKKGGKYAGYTDIEIPQFQTWYLGVHERSHQPYLSRWNNDGSWNF